MKPRTKRIFHAYSRITEVLRTLPWEDSRLVVQALAQSCDLRCVDIVPPVVHAGRKANDKLCREQGGKDSDDK